MTRRALAERIIMAEGANAIDLKQIFAVATADGLDAFLDSEAEEGEEEMVKRMFAIHHYRPNN